MKAKLTLLLLALALTFSSQGNAIFGWKCCNYLHPSGYFYCDLMSGPATDSVCKTMCVSDYSKNSDVAGPYYYPICNQAFVSDAELF